MFDFKEEIAKEISKIIELDYNEVKEMIEIPKEKNMGDYAFPCFRLAQTLKKAPKIIANEINEKLKKEEINFIENIEAVSRVCEFLYKQKDIDKISNRRILK